MRLTPTPVRRPPPETLPKPPLTRPPRVTLPRLLLLKTPPPTQNTPIAVPNMVIRQFTTPLPERPRPPLLQRKQTRNIECPRPPLTRRRILLKPFPPLRLRLNITVPIPTPPLGTPRIPLRVPRFPRRPKPPRPTRPPYPPPRTKPLITLVLRRKRRLQTPYGTRLTRPLTTHIVVRRSVVPLPQPTLAPPRRVLRFTYDPPLHRQLRTPPCGIRTPPPTRLHK